VIARLAAAIMTVVNKLRILIPRLSRCG